MRRSSAIRNSFRLQREQQIEVECQTKCDCATIVANAALNVTGVARTTAPLGRLCAHFTSLHVAGGMTHVIDKVDRSGGDAVEVSISLVEPRSGALFGLVPVGLHCTIDENPALGQSISMPQKSGVIRKPRKTRHVAKGGVIQPSSQVLLLSPDQWEEFILAAARQRGLPSGRNYAVVKRLGGAGDGGRDIEARCGPALVRDEWDLYQAKHYSHGLTHTDAFPEMAKFFKQLALKTYPRPRSYIFCCPRAVGNDLHNTMASGAVAFKAKFLDAWKNEHTGMKGRAAELTQDVQAAIDDFDFSRFIECPVHDLLAWHALDRVAHHGMFGIVPERGDDDPMPVQPAAIEDVYLAELLRVYTEHKASPIAEVDVPGSDYEEHFTAQRQTFYCAEGLQRFSRDIYPHEEEFERLLEMVYAGIRPTVAQLRLKTGMDRVDAAVDKASTLQVQESRLSSQLRGGDLPGTCHHLVNRGRLTWVK